MSYAPIEKKKTLLSQAIAHPNCMFKGIAVVVNPSPALEMLEYPRGSTSCIRIENKFSITNVLLIYYRYIPDTIQTENEVEYRNLEQRELSLQIVLNIQPAPNAACKLPLDLYRAIDSA